MIESRTESSQTLTLSKGDTKLTFVIDAATDCTFDAISENAEYNLSPKINTNFDASIVPVLADAFAALCDQGHL